MSKKQTIKRTPLSKQVETVCKEGVAGNFTSDLPAEFLQYIGAILTHWTHTEYAMVLIFRELLNVDLLIPIEPVFFSIGGSQRIDILKKLLQEMPLNAYKGSEFDGVINEYKKLNEIRNRYVHAKWSMHENGKVYIDGSKESFVALKNELVELAELKQTLEEIVALRWKIGRVATENFFNRVQPQA